MSDDVPIEYKSSWPQSKPQILKKLDALGHIVIPIPFGQKRTAFEGWNVLKHNNLDGGYWKGEGGIAIKTGVPMEGGYLIAIDMDDNSGEFSDWFHQMATNWPGNKIYRTGKPPKFLMPATCAEHISKMSSKRYIKDGQIVQVEILGEGQYFVGYGTHPDTERLFSWKPKHIAEDLPSGMPRFTEEYLKRFIEAFEIEAEILGFEEHKKPRTQADRNLNPVKEVKRVFPDWEEALSPLSKKMLKRISQSMFGFLSMTEGGRNDELNATSLAFKSRVEEARLEEEDHDRVDAYLSARLREAAEMIGMDAQEIEPTIASGGREGEEQGRMARIRAESIEDEMGNTYVVYGHKNVLVNKHNFMEYTRPGLAIRHPEWNDHEHGENEDDNPSLWSWLIYDARVPQIEGYGWRPVPYGEEVSKLFEADGKTLLNKWKGFNLDPMDGDIEPWLKIGLRVCGFNEEYLKHLLDYCAYLVQQPHKKCNWHPVIVGVQGAGKDSFFHPIVHIFGDDAAGSVKSEDFSDAYDDAFVEKKLVILSEAADISSARMENLKMKAASTASRYMTLNPKRKDRVIQENLWAIPILSNNLDALRINSNERRFFILECEESLPPEEAVEFYDVFLKKENGANKIMGFLINRDISDFDPDYVPIKTQAFENMTSSGMSDWEAKITEMMDAEEGPFEFDFVLPEHVLGFLKSKGFYMKSGSKLAEIESFLRLNGFEKLPPDKRIQRMIDGKVKKASRRWLVRKGRIDNYSPSKAYTATVDISKSLEKQLSNDIFDI